MPLSKYAVGTRYGRALFDLAEEHQIIDDINSQLITLRELVETNPRMLKMLADKDVNCEQKQQLLKTLQQPFSVFIQNLLQMLYDYGHIDDLLAVIDDYQQRFDQANDRIHATVITAVSLSTTQEQAMQQALIKRFNAKEVVLEQQIDKQIIGGVIVRVKDIIIDGSLVTRIANLKNYLSKSFN